MKQLLISIVLVLAILVAPALADGPVVGPLASYLQDVSVTIKSGRSQGSGVIVTREIRVSDNKTIKINFIWTAGHVVRYLRSTRQVIDPKTGNYKQVIEFKDASLVKELNQNGRRVGEVKMEARVLKYSDATNGEDLALLMVRKHGFVDVNAVFHTDDPGIVPIGTNVFHVGSLLGQMGANSLTNGIVSQVGRVLSIGGGGGIVFDQTTAPAFPGSSGGGIFIAGIEDEMKAHRGEYCGMLVRGAGETFNLVVPVRRMRAWAKAAGVEWALDTTIETPTLAQLNDKKWLVEETGVEWTEKRQAAADGEYNKKFGLHYWLRDTSKPGIHLLEEK